MSLAENCISIHVGEMKLGALRLTMWTVRFQSHTFHSRGKLDLSFSAERPTSRKTRKVDAGLAASLAPDKLGLQLLISLTLTHGVIICNMAATLFRQHQPGVLLWLSHLIQSFIWSQSFFLVIRSCSSETLIHDSSNHELLQNIWSDALLDMIKNLKNVLTRSNTFTLSLEPGSLLI